LFIFGGYFFQKYMFLLIVYILPPSATSVAG